MCALSIVLGLRAASQELAASELTRLEVRTAAKFAPVIDHQMEFRRRRGAIVTEFKRNSCGSLTKLLAILRAPSLPTLSHIPARLQTWGFGGMSNHATAGSSSFGATINRPACPYCGEWAYLTRRSPHPDYHLSYERQTFICSACDHTIDRLVDANGNPVEYPTDSAARDVLGVK